MGNYLILIFLLFSLDAMAEFGIEDAETVDDRTWSSLKVSNEISAVSGSSASNLALINQNITDITTVSSSASSNLVLINQNGSDISIVSGSFNTHVLDLANPHQVTKSQVGLGNADNTSDANKPISLATQSALDGKYDDSNPDQYVSQSDTDLLYYSLSNPEGYVSASHTHVEADITDLGDYATNTDLNTVSSSASSNLVLINQNASDIITVSNSASSNLSLINQNASDISVVSGSFNSHSLDANAHHTPTVDTNAGTLCSPGEYLDGDATCKTFSGGAVAMDDLTDADTTTVSASIGDVLKWDGTNWAPSISTVNTGELGVISTKRTTTFALPATWTDVNFDTTTLENDTSVIDHDDVNRDRFVVKQTGNYFIMTNLQLTNTMANANRTAQLRLRINDTTVVGLLSVNLGKDSTEFVARGVSVPLNQNDFLTIQLIDDASDGVELEINAVVTMYKLDGAQGPTGPQGADGDITWEGAWVSQNYVVNQAVSYLGSSYVCKLNTTSSQVPTNTTYWDVLSAKGDTGSNAPPGSEVTASDFQATASSSYVNMPNMTLTPASGTYLVFANISSDNSASNGITKMAIGKAGSAISVTEKLHNGSTEAHLSTQARVTVNGSQAITIMWSKLGTGSAEVRERSLMIVEVQ